VCDPRETWFSLDLNKKLEVVHYDSGYPWKLFSGLFISEWRFRRGKLFNETSASWYNLPLKAAVECPTPLGLAKVGYSQGCSCSELDVCLKCFSTSRDYSWPMSGVPSDIQPPEGLHVESTRAEKPLPPFCPEIQDNICHGFCNSSGGTVPTPAWETNFTLNFLLFDLHFFKSKRAELNLNRIYRDVEVGKSILTGVDDVLTDPASTCDQVAARLRQVLHFCALICSSSAFVQGIARSAKSAWGDLFNCGPFPVTFSFSAQIAFHLLLLLGLLSAPIR